MSSKYVIKRKGEKVELSLDKIRASIEKAMDGLDHVSADKIIELVKPALRDSMTTVAIESLFISAAESLIEIAPEYSKVASRFLLRKIESEAEVKGKNKREKFVDCISQGVLAEIYDPRLAEYNLEKLALALDFDRDDLLEYLGLSVLNERYLVKHEEVTLELPQFFWMRVSMGLAILEKDREEWAIKFYNIISRLLSVPSTPTLFHSGLVRAQCASCFLNYVADDLKHIFKVASDNAQLAKFSGGIGTDVTAMRGATAFINSTRVQSQGTIPFIKIYNDTTAAINRSGKRRGASVVSMENWHIDFEDFLDLKKNTGDERRRAHDLNTASWVPDLFMQRVREDGDWTLFSPDEVPDLHEIYGKKFAERYTFYENEAKEGRIKIHKKVKAKALYRRMLTSLYETGGPWFSFKDPSNLRSPQGHVGVVHTSNLCQEILENTSVEETAVCNLQSINLARFVTPDKKIDYPKLGEVIPLGIRMLDNVIDINFYPIPEAKNSNERHRPIGMGQMGLQDMFYQMGLSLDSPEAESIVDELNEFIFYHQINASADLALEKGAYSTFKGSFWDRGIFPLDSIIFVDEARGFSSPVNRDSRLDWDSLKAKVKEQGMRNSLVSALAPTATISNISGCFPTIEPIYTNLYVKENRNGSFTVVNKYLVEDLRAAGLWDDNILEQIKLHNGSVQKISGIPRAIKQKYKGSFEIDPKCLIRLAAIRGKWVDQSQSFNIFLATTSGKVLSDTYMYAWEWGLKTTYYLRTLGVSQVEKATLGAEYGLTQKRELPTIEPSIKACSLDDPTCESCQ